MPPAPLPLLHPEVALALPATSARALLTATAAPPALVALCSPTAAPLDLARALFLTPVPARAAAALDLLTHLASPFGREALIEAAADVAAPTPDWENEPPTSLAARIVVRHETADETIQRIVERALLRLSRQLPARVGYELVARTPKHIDAATLASALATLGDLITDPWVALDDAGTLHAAALWHEVTKSHELRTVRADLVRVELATGRVTVTTARPLRVGRIAEALARGAWGDPRAFAERPAFTLKPLLVLGSAGLPNVRLPASIRSVAVVACQLATPSLGRHEVRAPDSLAQIEELTRSHGGYVARATLRFELANASHSIDAYVELPNKLGLREPRFTREVREGLGAIGILSPGAIVDDVVTLAKWVHPEWRWREVVGADAVANMIARAILVTEDPKKTGSVATEAMRAWGHALRAFPLVHHLDAGRAYALADDLSVSARSVGAVDRTMWRLDVQALREAIRLDLELDDGGAVDLPKGVIDLGVRTTKHTSLRAFYVMGAVSTDDERKRVAQRLIKAARPAHAVVFVPRGRKLARDLAEVEVHVGEQLGAASWRGKLDRVLADLDDAAPPRMSPPTDAAALPLPPAPSQLHVRITIDGTSVRDRAVIRINGTPCALPNSTFMPLLFLIAAHLSPPPSWRERRELRMTTPEIPSRIRKALGPAIPDGFNLIERDRHGSFRLNPATVIEQVEWAKLATHGSEAVRKLAREQARRPVTPR